MRKTLVTNTGKNVITRRLPYLERILCLILHLTTTLLCFKANVLIAKTVKTVHKRKTKMRNDFFLKQTNRSKLSLSNWRKRWTKTAWWRQHSIMPLRKPKDTRTRWNCKWNSKKISLKGCKKIVLLSSAVRYRHCRTRYNATRKRSTCWNSSWTLILS